MRCLNLCVQSNINKRKLQATIRQCRSEMLKFMCAFKYKQKETIPFSDIAEATDSSKSPELPIQVVQPYPTIWKPCSFKYFCSPLHKSKKKNSIYLFQWGNNIKSDKMNVEKAWFCKNYKKYLWSKYFVTTPEPGARLVFTHGLTWRISI